MLNMRATNILYQIGSRDLLDIKELKIHEGDRIGLVGRNGEGKSLLLQYLLGKLDVAPQVEWHTSYGWMKQMNEEEWKSSTMSGGEKTLARLERILSQGHSLLFLDEPTNNLDWEHIESLEEELLKHNGAYVLVSHDRKLLNRCCNKIWELEQGKLTEYQGNYDFYEVQKELERKQKYEKHEQYVKEKNRIEERIRQKQSQSKGMRKPPKRMGNSEWQLGKNKAAAHQKKVERVGKTLERRLDRLEKAEKPMEWDQVKMEFSKLNPSSKKALGTVGETEVQAGSKFLFTSPKLSLKNGSKTAFIGGNGTGKSTFIQHLLRTTDWLSPGVEVGYFHQTLEDLPLEKKVYDYASEKSSLSETTIRIILARLRFFAEDMNKTIGQLSGGERVKLSLAKLMASGATFLVLDEPTNHLDLEAIHALERLICDFPGTILFVTHDRTFIERTADQIWMIEDSKFITFDGTWKQWEEYVENPPVADDDVYDQMALETKLTELISRLSMPGPNEDVNQLEEDYQHTLSNLKKLKKN
ncbi:ABC-F family ATP-binding cassette domain-containing protein [Halobacillus sp. GSS1]|uniref:ribosomal protection-like ABC-F family protein n=1 Tax=Halobacillus sp. GSS1 TaxID=2815919 RepID=UPI001A8C1DCD|nr:ABC-F family ATP-binding cassette domain-containing protein [Halobacillus sp. GSS1]MBN9656090.1 ABC-F family ATP-binding cassette domain-containing protein [Halobacillus sp. GSS1]